MHFLAANKRLSHKHLIVPGKPLDYQQTNNINKLNNKITKYHNNTPNMTNSASTSTNSTNATNNITNNITNISNTNTNANSVHSLPGPNDEINENDNVETNNSEHDTTAEIKILGLNVCGLRSKLRNSFFESYCANFNIICLSETRQNQIDLSRSELSNYTCFIKEKTIPDHRYGGVHGLCMLVDKKYTDHAKQLNDTQSPYILWIKFNKEAFGFACIIGAAYFPGVTSRHKDNRMFEAINKDIETLKYSYRLPICIIGDLNAHTGSLDDSFVIEHSVINNCELDEFAQELFDINTNMDSTHLCGKRTNKDSKVDDIGKQLINCCKLYDLKIINGRFGADKGIGELTFNGPTGNSTIDYCITSTNFVPLIQDFKVDILDQLLSDFHSPISLTLKTNYDTSKELEAGLTQESDIDYEPIYSKWDDNKLKDFNSKFNTTQMEEANQMLNMLINGDPNQTDIDNITRLISDIPINAGLEINISKQVINNSNCNETKKENKPWFDRECQIRRGLYIRIRNRLRKVKSFQNIAALKNESKAYKKFMNRK